MKLTKKHIGRIFDVDGGDGSWWYMLMDVKKLGGIVKLLFMDNSGKFWIENQSRHHDWRPFPSDSLHKNVIKDGWKQGRQVD